MSTKKHLSKIELKKIIEAKLLGLKFFGVHGTAIKKYNERYFSALSGKQFVKLTNLMDELNVINKNVNKKADIEKAYAEWKQDEYVKEEVAKGDTFKMDDILQSENGKEYKVEKYIIDKIATMASWGTMYKIPFEIVIQSLTTNIKQKFKFNCIQHFKNWFQRLIDEQNSKFLSTDNYGMSLDGYTEMAKKPVNYKVFPDVILHGTELNEITGIETPKVGPQNNLNYINENKNDIISKQDIFQFIKIISVKLIGGGCNKHTCTDKTAKTSFYEFSLYNPVSMGNNCFFKCLEHIFGIKLDIKALRKKYELPTNTEINIHDALLIIKDFKRNIEIIDVEYNEELDDDTTYILLKGNHYYVVEDYTDVIRKKIKTKRGMLTFDFETRPTEQYNEMTHIEIDKETKIKTITKTKMYILKDTICKAYYTDYKSTIYKNEYFATDKTKTSARKFIDFLNKKAETNQSYNIIAHNGGNFDFYFIISILTDKELLDCDIQMRGTTIIGINYRGNLFKDSYCFLLSSLSKLSEDYKIEHGKISTMMLHDKEISSSELCFYKPHLTFDQFMDLENTDKEFWDLYTKYCLYDCIALYEIWEQFRNSINKLLEDMDKNVIRKAPLMACSTIGSHAKKIIKTLNDFKGESNFNKQLLEQFLMTNNAYDTEKYKFVCNLKRGGISHCHKAGKHMSGITGCDIASQYPASAIYCFIPCGKSSWVDNYDESKYGFYHLKNVKFNSYTFKPVAESLEGKSLNWASNTIDELYVDSYMLDYLLKNYGLESYNVVRGLVSTKQISGDKLFGKFVNSFYEQKKLQDVYKKEKSPLYNPALRSTIKLYLNSMSGKLVEDPSVHFSMHFKEIIDAHPWGSFVDTMNKNPTKILNGHTVLLEHKTNSINDWVLAGVMIYSYSKRLLFEYIKCLPNNSDDIVHVETDGLYFSTRQLKQFSENVNNYAGDYPVKFGEDLGNLKIEESTNEGQVAYFLGKKFYNITLNNDYLTKPRDDDDDNLYKIKGIPQSTINDDGSKKFLVDTQLYEDVYNWKEGNEDITRTFSTLKRNLFGSNNTSIMAYKMTRKIKPNCEYKLYE